MGELGRIFTNEYSFRYLTEGDVFPEWFMCIPGMENISELYGTKEVLDKIIHRVTPRNGSVNVKDMMKQNNVLVYNKCDLLESQMALHDYYLSDKFPLSDSHQIFYFYPEIPKGSNRYD